MITEIILYDRDYKILKKIKISIPAELFTGDIKQSRKIDGFIHEIMSELRKETPWEFYYVEDHVLFSTDKKTEKKRQQLKQKYAIS